MKIKQVTPATLINSNNYRSSRILPLSGRLNKLGSQNRIQIKDTTANGSSDPSFVKISRPHAKLHPSGKINITSTQVRGSSSIATTQSLHNLKYEGDESNTYLAMKHGPSKRGNQSQLLLPNQLSSNSKSRQIKPISGVTTMRKQAMSIGGRGSGTN